MATKKAAPAKKVAAKVKGKGGKANGAWAKVELPAGFKAISSGEFGDVWDFEQKPTLVGTVTGDVREVETGKGREKRVSRVITVKEDGTGKSYTVWESASLKGFFDHVQRRFHVALAFHGYRDVGRPQPMKVFEGAFSDEDAATLDLDDDTPPPTKHAAKKKSVGKRASR